MKFIYNEVLTKNVIENYYKTYEDIDGELEIKCGTRTVPGFGRRLIDDEIPYINFRLKGTMDVNGKKQPVELVVSEDEINNAFTTMIEATGRKVKRISMDFNEKVFNYITVEAVSKRKVK